MNKLVNKWLVSAVCAVSLLLTTSVFAADSGVVAPVGEKWAVSLGGVGATDTDASETVVGVDISVGRTGNLLLPVEFGVRQSVGYADSDTVLGTRLYNDWTVFTVAKKVDVFAGAAVGLYYGNMKPSWEVAPEAGVRWWVKQDVAVLARAEVPWDLDGWEFKDTVRYFVGFQVRW